MPKATPSRTPKARKVARPGPWTAEDEGFFAAQEAAMTPDELAEMREFERAYDAEEIVPVPNQDAEIARHVANARAGTKAQLIGMRIAQQDLAQVKHLAEREGIPYQTLIRSIVHKYVTGQLAPTKA